MKKETSTKIILTCNDLTEANNVLSALAKFPYEIVAPMITRLRDEIQQQINKLPQGK